MSTVYNRFQIKRNGAKTISFGALHTYISSKRLLFLSFREVISLSNCSLFRPSTQSFACEHNFSLSYIQRLLMLSKILSNNSECINTCMVQADKAKLPFCCFDEKSSLTFYLYLYCYDWKCNLLNGSISVDRVYFPYNVKQFIFNAKTLQICCQEMLYNMLTLPLSTITIEIISMLASRNLFYTGLYREK